MTQATSTALGEIKLAGDLAGSNNALIPELSPSGVTAGQYTIPTLTVDAKGRITAAVNTTGAELAAMIPDATSSVKGLVKIGSGLEVSAGTVSVTPIPDATSSVKGLVKIGPGLSVSSGTVSIDSSTLPAATTATKGVVQIGTGFSVASGIVSLDQAALPTASTVSKGIASIGSGLTVADGVVSVDTVSVVASLPLASSDVKGIASIGAGLSATAGVVSVDTSTVTKASVSTLGVVQIGANIAVTDGVISLGIPDATTSVKGIMQVGTGLTATSGVVSVDTAALPLASTSVSGLFKVGDGLSATAGVVSLNRASYASPTVAGLVKLGNTLQIDGDGVVNVNQVNLANASTTVKGIATVGAGLTVTDGIISVDPVPTATASVLGAVKIGSGVNISSGVISVSNAQPDATSTTKGIVQIGDGLIATAGVISMATAGQYNLGGVKVGTGFSIDGTGLLTAPIATSSVLGVVKVDGTTITCATDGTLTATGSAYANATASTKGVVQIGTGLSVASGVVSLTTGSASVKGVVQADGTTITSAAGVLSVNTANVVQKDTYVVTSKAVVTTPKMNSLTSTNTNYTLNLQDSTTYFFQVQGGSTAIGFYAPTNAVLGQVFRIILAQGSTPTTVQPTFNGAFVFPTSYTMASGALYGDMLECTVIEVSGGLKILTKVIAANQYFIGQ